MLSYFVLPLSLATLALARTDLTGCTSTDVSSPAGASIAWYVPGTGELCDFLDCGGGMAPPKTNVPGCPLYSGTSTYSPSYMPGYGSATAATAASSTSWSAAASTTAASSSAAAVAGSSAEQSKSATSSAVATAPAALITSISASSSASSSSLSSLAAPFASASNNTASPLICAVASAGCHPASTHSAISSFSTSTTIGQNSVTRLANGTIPTSTAYSGASGASGPNGTVHGNSSSPAASASAKPSTGDASQSMGGAWKGGAALLMGLVALVAAL